MSDWDPTQAILDRFPYGIFVVACGDPDQDVTAIVATWLTQISFSPPLVAVSLEKDGIPAGEISRSGRFSISLVPGKGIALARAILKSGPRFVRAHRDAMFLNTPSGVPVLRGSAGALECHVKQLHEAGDHLLVVAEVAGGESAPSLEMLSLKETGWKYRNTRKPSTT